MLRQKLEKGRGMGSYMKIKATREGANLKMTRQQEEECRVIYRKTAQEGIYQYHSIWNPGSDTMPSEEEVTVSLRSVFKGIFNYKNNDVFANIIGSKDDFAAGFSGSWKELLISYGINCDCCMTDGYFYDSNDRTGRTYFINCKCNDIIVGGHVINGFEARSMPEGSLVYLLPICSHHNSYCLDDTGRNGSGFYMMPRRSGKGIILNKYLEKTFG